MRWLLVGLALTALARALLADGYLVIGDDSLGYAEAFNPALHGNPLFRNLGIGLWQNAFVFVFGWPTGQSVAAITASLMLAFPMYALLKWCVPQRYAVAGALIFTWTPAFGTVLGYGYATLLSITLALWSYHWLVKYLNDERWRDLIIGIAVGLCISLTNASALPPYFLGVGILGIAAYINSHTREASAILLSIAASALLYVLLLGEDIDETQLSLAHPGNILVHGILFMGIYAYALKFLQSRIGTLVIAIALTSTILGSITSTEPELAAVFGRAWLWVWPSVLIVCVHGAWQISHRIQAPEAAMFGAGVAAMLLVGVSWHSAFSLSADEHSTLTPRTESVLTYLQANPGDVAVYPHSLGWHAHRMVDSRVVSAKFRTLEGAGDPVLCLTGQPNGPCDADELARDMGIRWAIRHTADETRLIEYRW